MTHYEVKGNLARLLATENLVVQHKAVDTASFNVQTRILTLPIWKDLNNTVYDLLVGHEVGHALFTPNVDLSELGVPQGYINITEDVRIEKLMKRKFPGLRKSFYEGYKQLNEKDFFSIWDRDLTEFSFADRINLHFKIGNYTDIPFNPTEAIIRDQIAEVETFEDAVKAAQALWKYRKEEEQVKKNSMPSESPESAGGEEISQQPQSSPDFGEEETESQSEVGEGDPAEGNESDEDGDQLPQTGSTDGSDAPEDLSTLESLESRLKDLASMAKSYEEIDLFTIKKAPIDKVVIDNKTYTERCREHYESKEIWVDAMESADKAFNKYRKEAAREVNYLVKEFECKKSAAAYARATTSKTGVLDTAMLHTYKYNDDIFKRVSIVPDGKNHGLIALIDWSGSISDVCHDMCKQVMNIAWFCKKAQIPFNAYIFTTEWARPRNTDIESDVEWNRSVPYTYAFGHNFNLVNVITTDCKAKDFELQLKYIFRLSAFFSGYGSAEPYEYSRALSYPVGCYLGGTPLSDAIVSLHSVIPYFRKKYGVEKLNVILLSDGEAYGGTYNSDTRALYGKDNELSQKTVEHRSALRNNRTGRVFPRFANNYMDSIATYIKDLKESYPDCNFVCFRLIESKDVSYWIRNASYSCGYSGYDRDAIKARFRKEKSLIIKEKLGYDEFYLMSTKSLSLDTDFEVDEGASKAKIRTAFKKSLGNKSVNKKILASFVDMVS